MPEANLLPGGEIDCRLALRPGTAERLARRGKLPHVLLPDGTIRFRWPDVKGSLQVRAAKLIQAAEDAGLPLTTADAEERKGVDDADSQE